MRIVFVGAVDFSRHTLEAVLENGGNVVGVITLDAQYARRHADFADLGPVADRFGVPVYRINKINDEIDLLRSLKPDVIFIFGWSQLISNEILELPPLGCIGTHPALLPKNRGRHPLIWALVEGLEQSGLTFLYLDEGVDSGDILWQKAFPITLDDDAGTLYEKIKALAVEAIAEFLPQLEAGTAPRIVQDANQATTWRKRSKADGEIDWRADTMETYNLVRALTHPYPGAHTYLGGEAVVIWKAALPESVLPDAAADLKPGELFTGDGDRLCVRTGDGYLRVVAYEHPAGIELEAGMRLGNNR